MLFKWGEGGLFLVHILEFWCVILYVKQMVVYCFGDLKFSQLYAHRKHIWNSMKVSMEIPHSRIHCTYPSAQFEYNFNKSLSIFHITSDFKQETRNCSYVGILRTDTTQFVSWGKGNRSLFLFSLSFLGLFREASSSIFENTEQPLGLTSERLFQKLFILEIFLYSRIYF